MLFLILFVFDLIFSLSNLALKLYFFLVVRAVHGNVYQSGNLNNIYNTGYMYPEGRIFTSQIFIYIYIYA
jgi:hypothetical protein